jgi:hypothetical protein
MQPQYIVDDKIYNVGKRVLNSQKLIVVDRVAVNVEICQVFEISGRDLNLLFLRGPASKIFDTTKNAPARFPCKS